MLLILVRQQSEINSLTRDQELALSKLKEEEMKARSMLQEMVTERDDVADSLAYVAIRVFFVV